MKPVARVPADLRDREDLTMAQIGAPSIADLNGDFLMWDEDRRRNDRA